MSFKPVEIINWYIYTYMYIHNCLRWHSILHIQSPSNAYKRFWFYAMKMGYLKFNFHTLVMLQFVWAPGSKQTLIRPFQKCTVHVCSLNDSKVMKCQSSRPPQKNTPRAFKPMKSSFCIVNRLSSGGPGSIPGVRKVWGFVFLKPFKLQQCILHF